MHSNGANHKAILDESENDRADNYENSGQSSGSEHLDDSDIVNMNGDGAGPPYKERRRTRARIHVPWLNQTNSAYSRTRTRWVWCELTYLNASQIRVRYCMLQGK